MSNESPKRQQQSQLSDVLQAWKEAGDQLFTEGGTIIVPKLAIVRATVEEFAIEVALTRRSGNITRAAKDLDTSRRALRDKLKVAHRYPWRPLWSLDLTGV